jgi:hypothetical protein
MDRSRLQGRKRSDAEPILTALCHCPHCQRQSGSSFSVNLAVPRASPKIEGATLKTFDDTGESGMPVQRRFCSHCGSPAASCSDAMPDLFFLKAGTLDDTSWLNPTAEIWCETAQPWIPVDRSRSRTRRNPTTA